MMKLVEFLGAAESGNLPFAKVSVRVHDCLVSPP